MIYTYNHVHICILYTYIVSMVMLLFCDILGRPSCFFLQAKMETFTRIRELVSRFRRVPGRSKTWWLGAREIVGEIGGVRQTQWFRKDSLFICIYSNNMMVCIHIIYTLYCIYIYLFMCVSYVWFCFVFVCLGGGTGHVHVLAPNMSPSGAWFPWSLPGSAPILVVIVQWKSIETPASNIIKEDHGMLIVYHSISFHYIYHMYGSCLQYTSIYYMYIYIYIDSVCHHIHILFLCISYFGLRTTSIRHGHPRDCHKFRRGSALPTCAALCHADWYPCGCEAQPSASVGGRALGLNLKRFELGW